MCLGPEIALVAQTVAAVAATAGTGYSIVQGQEAASASKKAEALRKQQLQLEATQKRRAAIRDFQLKRATSISNIQGATGNLEGSAYGGATSALSAGVGTNLGEIGQAETTGLGIFDANAAYSQASANAQAGSQIAQFGKDLFASGPAIGRLGATA